MSNEQVMKTVTKYTGSHAAPRNRKQRLDASTKNKKKTKNKKNPDNNNRERKGSNQKYRLKQKWAQIC